jgi:hypothetical protein
MIIAVNDNSQAAYQPPPPDPELQRLAPLIGTWQAKDYTQDNVLGLSVMVESTETYTWLDGNYFLVSTYVTVFDNEPAQTGVMYWGYNTETQQFHNRFFSNNGSYEKAGNEYVGVVANGKLTFTGPARFQYELDEDSRIKVNPDGTITVTWWLRDDGNWQPWMKNTFTKIK